MNWKFLLFYPQGAIALAERNVIYLELLAMAVLAIPFFITLIYIVRKYRAHNNATYQPELTGSALKQFFLWIPAALLVLFLMVIIWRSAHAVDPAKPIDGTHPPLTVQVVALRWKWLFIYPAQQIATVNFVEFPENTPINFVLTADAPMNSFSIPELGGQMYAMEAMTTHLNLIANHEGEYRGQAAEISGPGFAEMNFVAKSVSTDAFNDWVRSVKGNQVSLNKEEYSTLREPSIGEKTHLYAEVDSALFDSIVQKYMYNNVNGNMNNMMPNMQHMEHN
jgi:cytochrome o ubiquinol oxidase subunit 2